MALNILLSGPRILSLGGNLMFVLEFILESAFSFGETDKTWRFTKQDTFLCQVVLCRFASTSRCNGHAQGFWIDVTGALLVASRSRFRDDSIATAEWSSTSSSRASRWVFSADGSWWSLAITCCIPALCHRYLSWTRRNAKTNNNIPSIAEIKITSDDEILEGYCHFIVILIISFLIMRRLYRNYQLYIF